MITFLLAAAAFAGPTRAALGTTVTVPRTVVEPGEPMMLYLAMENRTDQRLYFEDHAEGPCFVEKYATVTLDPPAAKKPLPECKPGSRPVMPGEVVDFVVALNEVFELTADRYNVKVEWKDGGPDVYSPLNGAAGPITVSAPVFSSKVAKGDTIFLPNKNSLVFLRHEWKPPASRGAPPSLIIHFNHLIRGEGEFEKSVTIQTDKTHQVKFDGLILDVAGFQFDQWMDLRIFEKR
jgi:hypothetical protein